MVRTLYSVQWKCLCPVERGLRGQKAALGFALGSHLSLGFLICKME